jgi:hypothetical protein
MAETLPGVGLTVCVWSNSMKFPISVRSNSMKFPSMQHMPLMGAYLCQDCNCIGNCAEQCPACASEALIGLASVLNREADAATQQGFTQMASLAA